MRFIDDRNHHQVWEGVKRNPHFRGSCNVGSTLRKAEKSSGLLRSNDLSVHYIFYCVKAIKSEYAKVVM
jgi:hypothetical protein